MPYRVAVIGVPGRRKSAAACWRFGKQRQWTGWLESGGKPPHSMRWRAQFGNSCKIELRLAQELGQDQAKAVGDTHERCVPTPPDERAMDLYNNNIGRRLGTAGADCNAPCFAAGQDGTLQTSPGGIPPSIPYGSRPYVSGH